MTDTSIAELITTSRACLNCGEPMHGDYCGQCGQQEKEVRRPFLYFLSELIRVVFELDGRAYRTIYYLITRPAFLTREYFAGRRVSYTPPLRLFLFISIGFFLIVSVVSTLQGLQDTMLEVRETEQSESLAAEEDPTEEFTDINEVDENFADVLEFVG